MKYKALIFDLDGTAMPNQKEALPSQKVIEVVGKAQRFVKVSAATGRPIGVCRHILKALNLNDPCIITGGTEIIDPKTERVLWNKPLSFDQVRKIIDVCMPYDYEIFLANEEISKPARQKILKEAEQAVYIMRVMPKDAKIIINNLNEIKNVKAHDVIAWTKGLVDIHITHAQATKEHAVTELLKLENVDPKELIAVGDSNNDLPLLQNAGLKVAMGNATDLLKSKADFIAPSVSEDGLAHVIEKYIL